MAPFYFIICVTDTFPVLRQLVRWPNRAPQTPQQEKKDKEKNFPPVKHMIVIV
jgi:hypothetical protein